MIDPFSTFLGVGMGIASLALWIEFLDRWRQRGDDLVDELAEVERVLTSAIAAGLDDEPLTPESTLDASLQDAIRSSARPPGWTLGDEATLLREIFERDSSERKVPE